jgi:uracil-DNA glycosylase
MSGGSTRPALFSLGQLVGDSLIAPDWAEVMAGEREQIDRLASFLAAEVDSGAGFQPETVDIFRAFRTPLADVRVLVVGQDPYPTPGLPVGLAFSVAAGAGPLPASLRNIFRELHDDLGVEVSGGGDLSGWQSSGVMLLNRVLTVRPGAAGSHRSRGWEHLTGIAVRALAKRRDAPLVAVLWGRDAAGLAPLLAGVPLIESVHPSPLSAYRGFFGSRPFSRVNSLLAAQGSPPIDWAQALSAH